MIPTRWRTTLTDQVADAVGRIAHADVLLEEEEGSKALQAAYQAVVTAGTVRVWLETPPWSDPLPSDEVQRRVKAGFPNLFAALSALDLQDVLTSAWTAEEATPYVREAGEYVVTTQRELDEWLAAS